MEPYQQQPVYTGNSYQEKDSLFGAERGYVDGGTAALYCLLGVFVPLIGMIVLLCTSGGGQTRREPGKFAYSYKWFAIGAAGSLLLNILMFFLTLPLYLI